MAAAIQPHPAFGAYRVDQLGFCQCRFPGGLVDGEHRFCGRPTTVSRANKHGSWCDEHMAVVFEAWRPGGQVLRRAGRD
ncbi:hypothetical protein [Methylobacterium brachiatum]|uniref:hypothetical protein n=1 Tax=Methylobacterium brachiatum TaxID=269660 RepID=UPI00244D2597|nr:hypothetical protein [Methylobacterium brachiatum]MDH2313094.1 hypothetical protein [Methylobacterium brachiatum]